MDIIYRSTRGDATAYKASEAIIKGLCDDGGLFVPDRFPKLNVELDKLAGMNLTKETPSLYQISVAVMKKNTRMVL